LVLANLAVFGSLYLVPGQADEGTLVRMGALFRPAVVTGELWRLYTAMFLHAGWMHLGINMYGLYLLGRFTEDVFGSARYLAVYLVAGLGGAIASTLFGAGALSVGASGAIMGLLGGLIVTLVLRRGSWPEVWRKTLLWNLLLLGAMQIYIGFQVSMIDNAAHVGGMLAGAGATLLLAPGGVLPTNARGRAIAIGLAALLGLGVVAAGVLTARTSLPATLERLDTHEVTVGDARLTVPDYWELDASGRQVEDPYLDVRVTPAVSGDHVSLESPQQDDPRYRALLDRITATAKPIKTGL
jgi:membrane associated rhomboid family serine protease